MRVLVTGGAGFVGSNLAKRLSSLGHETSVLDDFSSASWVNLVDFTGDVLTCDLAGAFPASVGKHLTSSSIRLHHRHDGHGPAEDDAQQRRGLSRAVGSGVGVGQPDGLGQAAPPLRPRAGADEGIAAAGAAQRLRVFQAGHGAPGRTLCRSRAAPDCRAALLQRLRARRRPQGQVRQHDPPVGPADALRKRPRIFTDGRAKRDFVYIDDVVQANLKAATARAPGVFNAGSGSAGSFNEVVKQLNRVLKTDLPPEYFENPYDFFQTWTEADLTAARAGIDYNPQFDLSKGIDAYHASGISDAREKIVQPATRTTRKAQGKRGRSELRQHERLSNAAPWTVRSKKKSRRRANDSSAVYTIA